VVRIAGTPSVTGLSIGNSGDDLNSITAAGQTPIPGLRVEVLAEVQTTPVAMYEVITDKDGRPSSPIQVDSASEITIQSLEEQIAKFSAAGPASAFAKPLLPAIIATPMVYQSGACLTAVEGTPVVQFNYSNISESGASALVPITGLNPDLYRTPGTVEDDLLLNSIRSAADEIIPDTTYRAPAPNETSQLFTSGSGTFTVPYDTAFGPLTWSLIGSETIVDGSTALCQGEGNVRCDQLSASLVERLVSELRGTVSGTLKTAAKFMKLGKSPYLKTSARAIRRIKGQAASLLGAYICPRGAALPNSCRVVKFPADDLFKTHTDIFSEPSPIKPALFDRLQRSYNRHYRRFLKQSFPSEIVICSK
jgi:hypothetical protein